MKPIFGTYIKIVAVLAVSILFSTAALAQTKGFSKDPSIYIEELGAHVKTSGDRTVAKTYESFKELWVKDFFTEDQESFVIRMSEYMMLKKFEIKPDFNLLMQTLIDAKDSNSGMDSEELDYWIINQYKLIKNDRNRFLQVLTTSQKVFAERTLYEAIGKKWVFSPVDYKFKFDGTNVYLVLKPIDLICYGLDDSLIIRDTEGVYDIIEEEWSGKKGTIDWERVGIAANRAFAKFDAYKVDVTEPGFKVDTVRFTYKGVIDGEILGSLEDRVSARKIHRKDDDFTESMYPQFQSFEDGLAVKGFSDGDIVFKGGFGMAGNRIQGRGSEENKATFEFYYQGKLVVEAKSSAFIMTEDKINSQRAEIRIFTDSGDIYHPRVELSYTSKDRRLSMRRGQKGIEQAPFFDTDHNMEILVDQIVWKMDEPKLDLDMIIDEDRAIFVSKNYFKEYNYERITRGGMMAYHPIDKLYKYYMMTRSKKLRLSDYANFLGSKKENLYPQVIDLANQGFIYYDTESEKIEIKEKLLNYYKNHWKLADYDVIRFTSVISARPNATLNLVNYDLEMQGIRAFQFSDSQYVIAYPTEQIVTMKNNRRMIFSGKVTAGRFDFYGENFDFSYENFTINSQKIDSLRLWFPDRENPKFLKPVKSVLRDINGTLYIDKSNNKSGLTDYPEYPKFVSRAPSVIAYDKKNIFNGAYKKDIFRFEVDPFEIDSLDNFTIDGLKFPGSFVSGGILPEFRYEARIMEDYSLGFTRENPPGGYPMYGGKGHGDINISMSEEGFWADGEIDYEGAKLESKKILMTPDSTNADAEKYEIKRNAKYPSVLALDVKTRWLPKEDKMYVNTNEHDVSIFDDGQVFKGNLLQTPQELSGGGELRWDNATLTSAEMKFTPIHANADVSAIKIGDIDAGQISFVSTNVKSHIDFEQRIGKFRANEVGHMTEFPYNQFASSLDDFKWDMDARTIELKPTGRQAEEAYYFISRHSNQHGLKFQSTKALFDMNDGVIYAEEVPYIDIADSRVFPSDGKVTIDKDADIRPIENARVMANRENKYHELFECNLKINGRVDMLGTGSYIYKDKHQTNQKIYFHTIAVMSDTSTVRATGHISDSLNFTISPKIGYKGTVDLKSKEEFLHWKGFVKPLHNFTTVHSQWFRYMGQPDPSNVIVSANEPRNEDRRKVDIGISLSPNDSVNIYANFFGRKFSFTDLDIAIDTGVFFYDEVDDHFVAGDSLVLLEGHKKGNYITFSDKLGTITATGTFDLDLNQHANYNAVIGGTATKSLEDSTFTFNTMMSMTMKLPDECWDRMLTLMDEKAESAAKVRIDNERVKEKVAHLVSKKNYAKVIKDMEDFGELKLVDDLNKDIVLSNLQFYYSHTLDAFVSAEPIHLSVMHGKHVNKALDAKIMIERRRSGLRFVLYFELTKYDYFYFEFYRGNLFVYSTDRDFNLLLRQKGRKVRDKGYIVRPGSPLKVSRHVESIEALDE